MSGKLNNKVALILGAAGKDNMGQVMARRFAQEGAKIVVAGRNEDSLKEISSEVGGDYAVCDITKRCETYPKNRCRACQGGNTLKGRFFADHLKDGVFQNRFCWTIHIKKKKIDASIIKSKNN